MLMPNLIGIITAAYVMGIWCAAYSSGLLPWLYSSIIMVISILCWRLYARKTVVWMVVILFFCVGMLRFIHDGVQDPRDISHYTGQNVTVEGHIRDMPERTSVEEGKSKVRYILAVDSGQIGSKATILMTGAMYVSVKQLQGVPVPRPGDKVRVTGEVRELQGYNNPAQYDNVAAAKRQGIGAYMYTQTQEIIEVMGKKVTWRHRLLIWRETIMENMKKVMPEYHAAILGGMLFGGYKGIPQEIINDFATTGIVHILSVSGSHIALVVGVVTVLGTFVVRRFGLYGNAVPIVSAGLVTFYAIFCGLTPPVLRSLVMGLIALLAVCTEREKDAKNGLLLSALGMLLYQPSLLYDVSFRATRC